MGSIERETDMHCIIVLSMIPFSYEHKTNVIQSVLVKENFKQHLIVFSNIEPLAFDHVFYFGGRKSEKLKLMPSLKTVGVDY